MTRRVERQGLLVVLSIVSASRIHQGVARLRTRQQKQRRGLNIGKRARWVTVIAGRVETVNQTWVTRNYEAVLLRLRRNIPFKRQLNLVRRVGALRTIVN